MRVVVLGTGTEVGKTFVVQHLTRLLADQAVPVNALKPVETGLPALGESGATDASRLAAGSLHVKHFGASPLYGLRDGVSPHLAARREDVAISTARICSWIDDIEHHTLQYANASAPITLIETAGGVFSPLTDAETNLDLALALGPAVWVLTAPDALGVLHDVRATCTAMESVARAPDHLVLSAARPRDASTGTNADELISVGSLAPSAVVPHGDGDALAGLAHQLAALARGE